MARERCEDVEFSPEDAARTELDFLAEVVEQRHRGRRHDHQHPRHRRLRACRRPVRRPHPLPEASTSAASTGSSSASTATTTWAWRWPTASPAVHEGARQVECTINGIGERAGNCALEEIVMARQDAPRLLRPARPASTPSASTRPAGWCRTSPACTVQRNKAIVGQNAFAHEAGIHQHGMLKDRDDLRDHAARRTSGFAAAELVLGKHSGRHALRERARRAGLPPRRRAARKVFDEFKVLADKKKEIYDADIEALVDPRADPLRGPATCGRWWRSPRTGGTGHDPGGRRSRCGTRTARATARRAAATARSTRCSRPSSASPASPAKLRDYQIRSVTVGEDAQGEVVLEVEHPTGVYRGRALTTDIIEGSARAYLDVVNRIALKQPAVSATPGRGRARRMGDRLTRPQPRRQPDRAPCSRRSGTRTS